MAWPGLRLYSIDHTRPVIATRDSNLSKANRTVIMFSAFQSVRYSFGAWLSPVERTVRVREVPSSNLGAPTVDFTDSVLAYP